MKSILISIQPKWAAKILNGEKTIEIRKTMPKCELPAKVFIYCTQAKQPHQGKDCVRADHLTKPNPHHIKKEYILGANYGECLNGKVVAEFILKNIETIEKGQVYNASVVRHNACLNIMQLHDYIKGKKFHAWHIDNLKVYDKPKELNEFVKPTKKDCKTCFLYPNMCKNVCEETKQHLFRPPQDWCYVEDLLK